MVNSDVSKTMKKKSFPNKLDFFLFFYYHKGFSHDVLKVHKPNFKDRILSTCTHQRSCWGFCGLYPGHTLELVETLTIQTFFLYRIPIESHFIVEMRSEPSNARSDGSEVHSMVLGTPLHIIIPQFSKNLVKHGFWPYIRIW